jgi:Mlc titration factor MtfA (ptsG expression regulator)
MTKLITVYILFYFFIYLVLSLIGLLWYTSYREVIIDPDWFVTYSTLMGWWVAVFPAREYYVKNREHFADIL